MLGDRGIVEAAEKKQQSSRVPPAECKEAAMTVMSFDQAEDA